MGQSNETAIVENRRVVEQFWATMGTNDFRAAGACLHDDFVLDWPQSDERIRGRENFAAVNENYPAAGPWRFVVRRLIADERGVATEVEVTDGRIPARAITFSEVREGRIVHQTEYWPDPFAAAPWRARWVERAPKT
jgi:ketosteroid isomerase-like protein